MIKGVNQPYITSLSVTLVVKHVHHLIFNVAQVVRIKEFGITVFVFVRLIIWRYKENVSLPHQYNKITFVNIHAISVIVNHKFVIDVYQ